MGGDDAHDRAEQGLGREVERDLGREVAADFVAEFVEVGARWRAFERSLAVHLARMDDPAEADMLVLEVPGADDDAGSSAPYVQFAASGGGTVLHTEVWGDDELEPPSGDTPMMAAPEVARRVVRALRERFRVAHPDLLTYRAWGPSASNADDLGLCASNAVPVDTVDQLPATEPEGTSEDAGPATSTAVHEPESREELLLMVGAVLRRAFGEVVVDDDGDFVLTHLDQPVFVRALPDQPAVKIFTRVVHGVRSQRSAAVEVGLLNRDEVWVKWTLRGRSVWQTLMVPAMPFAELHLRVMVDLFCQAMERTRDDLAVRTGGEVA